MRNLLFTALIFLAACQPQVFLMPTPEALRDPDFNLFEASPEPLATNTLNTLYATTREPADRGASHFTARKGDQLYIGYANVMVGDEGTELSSLIAQSTTEDRGQKFAITLSGAPIIASATLGSSDADVKQEHELQQSLAPLSAAVNSMPVRELTIFVHGAGNTFYEAVARGSMFQYFSGNNAAVLTFSWPNPGNVLRYGKNKKEANAGGIDLALLIEILARHTTIEQFNLLAYSAGGRTAAEALAELGRRYQDPSILRLGEVYFAQSDQPVARFLEDVPLYFDLVKGVTITAAPRDGVLRMARMTDGKIRLGALSESSGDDLALSPDIVDRLTGIFDSERMVIIDLTDVPATGYRFKHSAWYDSPWVSTDVMAALLGGLSAEDRGLVSSEINGFRVWRFPPDYVAHLKASIREWREQEASPD